MRALEDGLAAVECQQPSDEQAQLADVERPVVATQPLDEAWVQAWGGLAAGALGQQAREQVWHLLDARAQRWQAHLQAVQPREEIAPKALLRDRVRQRRLRRHD